MTVRTKYTNRQSMRELTVTLAHLLQDSEKPPLLEGVRQVIDLCSKNKMQIIVGCDANAHHIIKASMDINQ
jgi:RNase P/RNase MRP subunit p30